MSKSSKSSKSSSYSHDPDYQPCGRLQTPIYPSVRLTTSDGSGGDDGGGGGGGDGGGGGGGGGGGNQHHIHPKKRISPRFYNPSEFSPNPTIFRQGDAAHASLTHDDTGKSHYENATRNDICSTFVDPSFALIHHSVFNKYGDIGRKCLLVNPQLRTYILESIYKVVQELQGKTLETLDENTLDSYDLSLRDAEYLKFDVKWLRKQLDVLRDGVKAFVKTTQARDEKIKLTKCIDDASKNLKRQKQSLKKLQLEVTEQEKDLAVMTTDAENLSCTIRCLELKYQHLEGVSLVDGLL